jgi:hypothetical protein
MLQHMKLILFTAALTSASFSRPGGLGYGAAVQMAAAGLHAMAWPIARWRRRSGRVGIRPHLRCVRGHPAQHAA